MKEEGTALTFEKQPIFDYPYVDLEIKNFKAPTGSNNGTELDSER